MSAGDALHSKQFGERPTGKHCLAYLLPVSSKGEGLFVKPDVNGEAGVHVHSYDEVRSTIQGRSAHRFDYDTGEFRRAKVHRWEQSDALGGGTHRRTWSYPAGGDLGDAERI